VQTMGMPTSSLPKAQQIMGARRRLLEDILLPARRRRDADDNGNLRRVLEQKSAPMDFLYLFLGTEDHG